MTILAQREFSVSDQKRFASVSGDHNPMRLDALQARSTQAGTPVVHGIDLLLWALDSLAAAQPNLPPLRSFRAQFNKFVYLNECVVTSLNMEITFQPFDETGRSRIAQLINKSNQYNLTTHRYTEADVAAMQIDPSCLTLQVRLVDALGDNGMISVVIGRYVGDHTLDLDTWLMSCRVLGRKVEHTVLQFLLEVAAERGIRRIIGQYVPTERNGLVRDHYSRLDFRQTADLEGNGSTWELDIANAPKMEPIMVAHSKGFGRPEMSKA